MRLFRRLLALLGIGEHAEFIWEILDWLGLTKPLNWFIYLMGGGVGGYFAKAAALPPIVIFLCVITAGLALAFTYAFLHSRSIRPTKLTAHSAAHLPAEITDAASIAAPLAAWRPISRQAMHTSKFLKTANGRRNSVAKRPIQLICAEIGSNFA